MDWNRIENGPPPAGVPLIVTVRNNESEELSTLCPVYYMKTWQTHWSHGAWGWYQFADVGNQIGPHSFDVVAWMEYPAPFGTKITKRKTIEDMELSVRSHNVLMRNGFMYVDELTQYTESQISSLKNLGYRSLFEIKNKMTEMGYGFKEG